MYSREAPDETRAEPALRDLTLGHRSLVFLIDQVSTGVAGLSPRDALLVMAINQANIAPLTREHQARVHYGHLENPAPDAERRPVSVSAIAVSLGLPFETVRRRIKHLETLEVCTATDHGIIVPETFLASPAYLESVVAAQGRLRAFYWELRDAGLLGDLPPSGFDVGHAVPVRAAVRLLSDYILRVSDMLKAEAGDVVSTIVLMGVLAASTAPPPAGQAISISALSQRLHLAEETVRRHARQLVDRGLCARVPGGLLVTPEILAHGAMGALFRQNAANVQRLFAGLAERGVVGAWERLGRAAGR